MTKDVGKPMKDVKYTLKRTYKQLQHLSQHLFNIKNLVISQQIPYQCIFKFGPCQIRYYPAVARKYQEPLVFVAPLAINMSIYDLYPDRSLIGYFIERGFDVYLIDWGKLSFQHRHLNFIDFIQQFIPSCITRIREHARTEQISLHGWSMAGLFVLLYSASAHPNFVKNLIVLGSPIDSYASGNIGKLYNKLNQLLQHNSTLKAFVYQNKFPHALTHSPGLLNTLGFKLLTPKAWYHSHKQLLMHLDNAKMRQQHATINHFLNHMIDYPGALIQDMLFNFWLQNPLTQGKITLHGQLIELKNINCSLLVGAGDTDQIVTAAAAQPLTQLTNSQDVSYQLIPGGHLGLMSSQKSAEIFWPTLYTWLKQRSTAIESATD